MKLTKFPRATSCHTDSYTPIKMDRFQTKGVAGDAFCKLAGRLAIGGTGDLTAEGDRYGCNGGGEPDIFSRRSSSAFLWSSRTLANSWLAAAVLPKA
jgi:hypothetical protein